MSAQTQIMAQIEAASSIVIHRHQRPDPDAVGSQQGLANILKTTFPEKKIYSVGKQVPSMAWMGEMDIIPDEVYDTALVIVTDTANEPRVDDRRYDYAKTLIKIDHHPNDEPFGDYSWIDDTASSTSEMIYRFYDEFSDKLKMTREGASYLYSGIIGDTGRFLHATTPTTMETAAALMRFGFDWTAMTQRMDTITPEAAKATGYVYDHMTLTPEGVGYIILEHETLTEFGLGDFSTAFIVPVLGSIDQAKAWVVFEEQEEGFYRARLRSRNIVINDIAKRHGGGGHKFASGAIAENIDEVHDIINEMKETVKEQA